MQHDNVDRSLILAWLAAAQVCQGLLSSDLDEVAGHVKVAKFAEGEVLANIGDEVHDFWIIAEGSVEVYLVDTHGGRRLLGVLGPGDQAGEVALMEKASRPASFVAQTGGRLLSIPGAEFLKLVDDYPVLMRNLFRKLSARYREVVGVPMRKLPGRRLGISAPSGKAMIVAGRLIARLLERGERLVASTDRTAAWQGIQTWPEALPLRERGPAAAAIPEELPNGNDRVVTIGTAPSSSAGDASWARGCDEVLWILDPREAAATIQDLNRLDAAEGGTLRPKLRLVWLLGGDQPVAPWIPGSDFGKPDIKIHVEGDGRQLTRLERQGIDRLERALRGYSLGIALAGGGAKGMAHLGVLKALDDEGLSFDAMSGSSAGAMAGIIYASGIPAEKAVEYFQADLTPSRLFRLLPGWPNLYLLLQFRRKAWDAMMRPYLRDWKLEQLPIPFSAMTVDLIQGRTIVRRTGDAVHAILESINLPVMSRPILREGMVLVDGGMLNNLPADVLAMSGSDFVVGVDISRRMRREFAGNRPDTPFNKMKNAGSLDTLLRIFESQAHNLSAIRNRAVDFWITPDTSSFAVADFYRTREIARVGEVAARVVIPELKSRLAALEKSLLSRDAVR